MHLGRDIVWYVWGYIAWELLMTGHAVLRGGEADIAEDWEAYRQFPWALVFDFVMWPATVALMLFLGLSWYPRAAWRGGASRE